MAPPSITSGLLNKGRKTQDVLDYIYEFKGKLSVIWIHASSATHFERDYRKLATLLKLPGHDDQKIDIRPVVKSWLEGPASGEWVIVLDNADDVQECYPELGDPVRIARGDGIAKFVPRGSKGTVIVTTRDKAVASKLSNGNVLEKKKMDAQEAMQLFTNRYKVLDKDKESVEKLLEELQYLPLAIVQAAAYLDEQNELLSPAEYFREFKDTKAALLSKQFLRGSTTEEHETILTTFAISFEQIKSQSSLAGRFLGIIACIDRQGIPHDLFRKIVPEDSGANIGAREALSKLIDFALITVEAAFIDAPSSLYVMHALVHVSLQQYFANKGRLQAALREATCALRQVLPHSTYETWSVSEPH